MTAASLTNNVPVFATPFDNGLVNSVIPTPAQLASGFVPNVDTIKAEQQNYLHNASTTALWLQQQLGLALPFNPDGGGASLVATPKGGVVSIKDSVTGETKFYIAKNNRAVGYTDPSLDPTNWVYFNILAASQFAGFYADATGTSDAITATYTVVYPVLVDGFPVEVAIVTPNTITTPTFAPTINGSAQTPRTIVKFVNNVATSLAIGDLQGVVSLRYDLPNLRWILLNPNSWNNSNALSGVNSNINSPIQPGIINAIIGQDVNQSLYRYNLAALQAFGVITSANISLQSVTNATNATNVVGSGTISATTTGGAALTPANATNATNATNVVGSGTISATTTGGAGLTPTNATNATNATNVIGTIASGVIGATQVASDNTNKIATTAFVHNVSDIKRSVVTISAGSTSSSIAIPASISRVTLKFRSVSFGNTSAGIIIQLGSGGTVTTGYLNISSQVSATSAASQSYTNGFNLYTTTTPVNKVLNGTISLDLENALANTWTASGTVADTTNTQTIISSGGVSLPGQLDAVVITVTTAGGFLGGEWSAGWEF